MEQQRPGREGTATVVATEPAPATSVLRLRSGAAAPPAMRVTWTSDTVEINEFSGKKKSKSTHAKPIERSSKSSQLAGPALDLMARANHRGTGVYLQSAAYSIPLVQRATRVRTATATATATAIAAMTGIKILGLPQQRGSMHSKQSAPRKRQRKLERSVPCPEDLLCRDCTALLCPGLPAPVDRL